MSTALSPASCLAGPLYRLDGRAGPQMILRCSSRRPRRWPRDGLAGHRLTVSQRQGDRVSARATVAARSARPRTSAAASIHPAGEARDLDLGSADLCLAWCLDLWFDLRGCMLGW